MSTYTAFAKTRIPAFYFQSLQAVRRRSVRCITCLRRSVNSKRDQVIQHKNAIHQVGVTSLLRTVAFNKVLPVRNYASNYEKSTELSYEDLVALLESGGIQLIDVREKREIQEQGAFPGSVNIPLGELFEALEMPPHKYKALYGVDLPDYEDDNIVFTCYCGIRSLKALQLAYDLGFQRARHYAGGFEEWKQRQLSH